MSIPLAIGSAQWQAAVRLAAGVERRSQGRLKIEIYPNGSLANQSASIQGLASGVVDLTTQASVFLEPLFPKLQVLDVPFLLKDGAAARRVLDTIGQELFADMEAKGIRGFVWGPGGFRQFETNSRPIVKPADVKGMRIRIQNAPISVGMIQALGGIPVTIDFSEVYTALQQHTVDGLETALDAVAAAKLDDIIKYVAITNHVFATNPLVGSKARIDAMPGDLQKILAEEARAALPLWWTASDRATADAVRVFRSKGITFTEVDHAAFRRAMDPVYASVQSKLGGDLLERISRIAGA